jgi:tetratricopeptide (TPR) repeat protein
MISPEEAVTSQTAGAHRELPAPSARDPHRELTAPIARDPFRERAFQVAAAGSLALLLFHVWWYRFLTDDAFISFRYARNLADGFGLVFNPGFERVEGYTNFLWVLILAAFDVIGIAPERIANVLSTLCGVAIWWAVYRYCRRRADRPVWIAVLPLFLLAGTRSFAVWCTSGLETKLFEMLAVLGVLTALDEIDAARAGGPERWTRSSLLLALACLTRPDGVLIAGCVFATRFLLDWRRTRAAGTSLRAMLRGAAIFALLVGGHLVFRRAYYDDWVPNTYYAKVGGDTWIEMGLRYLLTFAIEYGVVFWLPLLAASVVTLRREGRAHHGLLFAAAVLPHAMSLVAIGGDHFEYRPLDLYFPFAYILIADGASALLARTRPATRLAAAGLLAAAVVTMITIPILTRIGFPDDYRAGFPGAQGRPDGSRDLVSRSRFRALFGVPVVGATLDLYNAQIEKTTLHAVGIRQEEHALFLPTVVDEGQRLADLVSEGTIPRDAHIAIGSVGAIPYYSNLRTLDRQGLTDKVVARGEGRPKARRLMAHNKLASFDDAIARGVDLWSPDGTHLIYKPSEQRLQSFARLARDHSSVLVAARAGRNRVLLAEVPIDRAPSRLPRVEPATIFFAREAQHPEAPSWVHMFLGDLLSVRGNFPGAISAYEASIARDSTNANAMSHLGALLLQTGDAERAVAHLTKAVALAPRVPKVRADLARAYAALDNYHEVIRLLRESLAETPDDPDLAGMLARFLATAPDPSVRNPEEALRIAEDLNRAGRPRTIFLLDTLAAAYASAGRFQEARQKALEAAAFALDVGDTTRAAEIRDRAEAYGAGKMPWSVPRT